MVGVVGVALVVGCVIGCGCRMWWFWFEHYFCFGCFDCVVLVACYFGCAFVCALFGFYLGFILVVGLLFDCCFALVV